MTKDELVKAAMSMDVVRGAAEKLRAQQRNAQGANPGALEEWCPPKISTAAPKKRARALPPARTACGLLMDGDRLGAHLSQCLGCKAADARLQVSNDGVTWTNYTGALDGIDGYRHVRTQWIAVPAPAGPEAWNGRNKGSLGPDAMVAPSPTFRELKCSGGCGLVMIVAYIVTGWTCPACTLKAKAAREAPKAEPVRLCRCGKAGSSIGWCNPCWSTYVTWLAAQGGTPYKGPERLDHQPSPLVHSYGIEDPALPDA